MFGFLYLNSYFFLHLQCDSSFVWFHQKSFSFSRAAKWKTLPSLEPFSWNGAMSGSHFLSYLSSPFEGKVYEFRRGLTIFSWRTFLKSDSYLLFGFNKNLFRCHTLPSGKRWKIWTHFRGTVPCLSVRIVITVWRKSWWVSMWIDHFQPRNFFHLGLSRKLPKWCPNLHLKLRRENYLSKDVLTIFAQKYPTNFDPEFSPFLLLNFKYITKTANLFHIHEHF